MCVHALVHACIYLNKILSIIQLKGRSLCLAADVECLTADLLGQIAKQIIIQPNRSTKQKRNAHLFENPLSCKNEVNEQSNMCPSPISGSESPHSQANSARKAGWSFPIV